MRVVFFATYYEPYLAAFLENNPGFEQLPYDVQQTRLLDDAFGSFGPYVRTARSLGADAHLIVANMKPMQRRWALEQGVPFGRRWQFSVAAAQVRRLRPDVLFIGSMFPYYGEWLESVRSSCGKVVGWISCAIPPGISLRGMALVISAGKHFVERFRAQGVASELLPAAFDADVLGRIGPLPPRHPLTFVGGLTGAHGKRHRFLDHLARHTPLELFGYGMGPGRIRGRLRRLLRPTPIERRWRGLAWGLDMYRLLARSQVTVNVHIDAAESQVGNMRMYEATGMGAALLTDAGQNLRELFEPGREVAVYSSPEEAVDLARYLLSHPREASEMARAGQARTLATYTYQQTTPRLLRYLAGHTG